MFWQCQVTTPVRLGSRYPGRGGRGELIARGDPIVGRGAREGKRGKHFNRSTYQIPCALLLKPLVPPPPLFGVCDVGFFPPLACLLRLFRSAKCALSRGSCHQAWSSMASKASTSTKPAPHRCWRDYSVPLGNSVEVD